MKPIELKPIRETTEDYEEIEKEIALLFKREIYLPLLKELGFKRSSLRLTNSTDDLLAAIRSGRIYFSKGQFQGRFNSTLSRELRNLGAVWDRKQGSFTVPQSKLTIEIRQAIALSESRFRDIADRMNRKLSDFLPDQIAKKLNLNRLFDKVIYKVEKKFEKSVKGITVAPQLTPERKKRIAEEYTQNLQLYIQDFTKKEIDELRERIQKKSFEGRRYESIIEEIQESYGVSFNKAKFLARQETSLLMTKYKQDRYQAAGVNQYRWTCVRMPHQSPGAPYRDGQVRYHHAEHNGKIFSWDNPPIVNEKGDRKNPGQDYNCRCYAIPLVKF